jgi:putative transcriptional regulator
MTLNLANTMDTLLARYVAGTLPEPSRLLVSTHLQLKGDNRHFVRDLEGLAGHDLDLQQPQGLSRRDERLNAIFASAAPVEPEIRVSRTTDGIFTRELASVPRMFRGARSCRVSRNTTWA